jgi:threonine aldolase
MMTDPAARATHTAVPEPQTRPAGSAVIDLRSDTVTQPTDAMREAMARADVGDDVFGEDPTINALEALAAERLGKQAAVFVPTGTMANVLAVMSQTQKGDEVVVETDAHIYGSEAGALATLAGTLPRPITTEWGHISVTQLESVLRPPDHHYAPTRLVCLENPHNRQGGTVATVEQVDELAEAAHRRSLTVHLDGARIFNAAVALGVPASRLAASADTVGFCLSKGLSAPVGSVLCGTRDVIGRARHFRKMLGGGMRQAGVIAAAGVIALEQMVDRLADDHRLARALAEGLSPLPGLRIDLARVQTNMVRVDLDREARPFADLLRSRGVRVSVMGTRRIRLVTHRHIRSQDVPVVIETFKAALGV